MLKKIKNNIKLSFISKQKDNLSQKSTQLANRWMAKNKSLVLRQTPVWAQSLILIVLSVGSLTLMGAIFFRIDEVVTVSGQLESVLGSKDIATPAGGKISEVFYSDGQSIKKGDLLVRFDTTKAADEKKLLSKLLELEYKKLENQSQILNSKKAVAIQKLNTAEEIGQDLKELVLQGGFQRVQYLRQLDEIFELKDSINTLSLQINQLEVDSRKSINQLNTQLASVDLQLKYQNVRSPIDGIIFNPRAYVGSVLQTGSVILTIVPKGDLRARVFIPNKDIGFVKYGQDVKVRVDAFPFTKYGELIGRVSNIGADALPPNSSYNYYHFPISIELYKSYLELDEMSVPLRNGMSVTANLKLRDKPVISLISDIFVDQTESVKSIRQQ